MVADFHATYTIAVPELEKNFRSKEPITIRETTDDESSVLLQLQNKEGDAVWSVDNEGILNRALFANQFPHTVGKFFSGDPFCSATANGGPSLNDCVLGFPLIAIEDITLDYLGINVVTLQASAVSRLGVFKPRNQANPYSWDSAQIYADLLVDGGTVDCSTTGIKSITIDLDIPAGTFFCLAQCPQVALATISFGTPSTGGLSHFGMTNGGGAAQGQPGFKKSNVTGAFPATLEAGASATNRGCGVVCRRSA
jgi:hypothetical protein